MMNGQVGAGARAERQMGQPMMVNGMPVVPPGGEMQMTWVTMMTQEGVRERVVRRRRDDDAADDHPEQPDVPRELPSDVRRQPGFQRTCGGRLTASTPPCRWCRRTWASRTPA